MLYRYLFEQRFPHCDPLPPSLTERGVGSLDVSREGKRPSAGASARGPCVWGLETEEQVETQLARRRRGIGKGDPEGNCALRHCALSPGSSLPSAKTGGARARLPFAETLTLSLPGPQEGCN